MAESGYKKEIETLLKEKDLLAVADFVSAWPGVPMPTVYSRIRLLLKEGVLTEAGRGLYRAVPKPQYTLSVSKWMQEVNNILLEECEGIDHCLYERGANLYVETFKVDIPQIVDCLRRHYPKVIRKKDEDMFPAVLEGYIIVGNLISDAPIMEEDTVTVPTLEKMLVDNLVGKSKDEKKIQFAFQKAMEVYPVNVNRMKRYAARRGVKEELSSSLAELNVHRMEMISAAQKFFAGIPVLRAWIFGSFARGEETSDSDLDLLVDYDESAQVSLLDIIRYKMDLEKIIGREVDLIEHGYLKPFATPSAEHEKYLVYERYD